MNANTKAHERGMNRHERRANAALERAAHDAETAARTSALRRGDPMPDTVDRLALLLGCAENVRQMFEVSEANGLESPVVLLCDLRSDLARSIIGPTLLTRTRCSSSRGPPRWPR